MSFRGVHVATLVPFTDDNQIDVPVLDRHIQSAARVPGIRGVLANGHAGEGAVLSAAEQRLVLQRCRSTLSADQVVIAGIHNEGTDGAISLVHQAHEAGADAILVFPPLPWALSNDVGTVVRHHEAIAKASRLPIFLYQAGVGAGSLAYSQEQLTLLLQIDGVIGVKEGSWEVAAYERNLNLCRAVAPASLMMASGDEHMLTASILGSDGCMVSLAAIAGPEIVALQRAISERDFDVALSLHRRLQPLANTIYGRAPGIYATARLKACLGMLGQFPNSRSRSPLDVLPDGDIVALKSVLQNAQLESARGGFVDIG